MQIYLYMCAEITAKVDSMHPLLNVHLWVAGPLFWWGLILLSYHLAILTFSQAFPVSHCHLFTWVNNP